LKLFNLLLAELGPLVLARGLILEQDELESLLQSLSLESPASSATACPVLLKVLFNG
jgi:hypothetical protein